MPAPAAESTAISKLGRFFRLSEVHLWDDSYEAFASDTGYTGSQTAKTRNKPPKPIDEDHSTVEDLELANLMGSLGFPVSFSTSKEKKKTPNRGKKKGRQAPHEAENAAMDDARTSANTEEIESTSELMVHVEHTDSCNASSIETGVYVEKSGCGTTCSDELVLGDEAENQCEHDNMSTPINSDSLVQENQAVDIVMQLNKEMSRRNSVDNESGISCHELYQEGRLSIVENQISGETPSMSHDNNDVDHQSCLSQEEPCPVDNHVQKSGSDIYYEYGDWKVLWDLFYSRYYFYNGLTQESTWYPPQGLEDFASYGNACTSKGLDDNSMYDYITEDVVQYGAHLSTSDHGKETFDQAGNGRNLDEQGHDSYSVLHILSDFPNGEPINQSVITTIDEAQHAENVQNYTSMPEVAGIEKKKRVRRSQSYHSCEGLDGYVSNDIAKYWIQRYSLFSLFDNGVKMDEEGWFSVTPELIAKHHASRVGAGIVIDCFTGVGGNAIQFATKCKHVVAVDIDPQKIGCTRHNATVYGVNDNIDFIVGDFIQIAPHLKGETAFMSPPWGGPDYAKVDVYDMKTMLMPCDGYSLFKLATTIAPRVVMFLPRNIDLNQLAEMCLSVDPPWAVEVEKNFLNGKLKAITAYFQEQDGSDVQCW